GPNGTMGLVATNTIWQGDSRLMSLKSIVDQGGLIFDAVSNFRWPGAAAVTAATVHIAVGSPSTTGIELQLDGHPAPAISTRLRPKPERPDPVDLHSNT